LSEGTLTPGVPADDAELAKWDTALTYDMTEEADQIRLILTAPKGLYTASGSSLVVNSATYQTRYIELDGGGVPTGDVRGWQQKREFAGASQSQVTYEDQFALYDPATYAPSSPGNYAGAASISLSPGSSTLQHTSVAQLIPAGPVETTEFTICIVVDEPVERPDVPTGGAVVRQLDYQLLNNNQTDGIRIRFSSSASKASVSPLLQFSSNRIQIFSGGSVSAWSGTVQKLWNSNNNFSPSSTLVPHGRDGDVFRLGLLRSGERPTEGARLSERDAARDAHLAGKQLRHVPGAAWVQDQEPEQRVGYDAGREARRHPHL